MLNRISVEEAKLIDSFHKNLRDRKNEKYKKSVSRYDDAKLHFDDVKIPPDPSTYSLDGFSFVIGNYSKALNISRQQLEYRISNLVSLNLLKWETDVEVTAKKSNNDPEDDDIDVDAEVSNNDVFIFTPLGDNSL